MIERTRALIGRSSGQRTAALLLALMSCVNCTSVSHTDAKETQDGYGGAAGAKRDSSGGSGEAVAGGGSTNGGAGSQGGTAASSTTSASAGAENSDCAAGKLLAPDLHAACIEDLGQGKLRLSYDFASSEQGLDFAPSTSATVTVNQGALVVVTASNDVGVAIFTKKLHVDKFSYQVTLLTGNTTLWYVNTVWSGSWNPDAGYGGYHDNTGRGFIINGTENNPDAITPINVGILQSNTIEHSNDELKWDQGGNVITKASGPLPVTDRILALGAWQSSAAYYNIVFEGTLN